MLARHPEARAEVAAVFRQAGLQAATEMGASPEKIIDAESSAFSSEMIELALVNDFERFIP